MEGIGLILLRIGIIEEPCECVMEPPGFISYGVSLIVNASVFLNPGVIPS